MDFNGDGRSDILWRDVNGRVTDWLGQANGSFAGNFVHADANAGIDWHIESTGDFNGDGRSDILWRNENGAITNWLGQANGGFASNFANAFSQVDKSWHVAGTGDFNGDGRSDILWRDVNGRVTDWLGQANGGFVGNFVHADANAGIDWHIESTGDFNGDGRSDILWRNDNGTITNWLGQANGGFASNFANASSQVDLSWHVAGTGDFNGDGRDDIQWRHNSGRVTDWLGQANGGFAGNFVNADANAGIDWHIESTGDFNGDNRSDILWRNDNGAITNWLGQPNGGFINNPAARSDGADTSWHVASDPHISYFEAFASTQVFPHVSAPISATIMDFQTGVDEIDLRLLAHYPGDDALYWQGSGEFTGTNRLEARFDAGVFQVDFDGDRLSDLTINVIGIVAPSDITYDFDPWGY